MAVPASPIKKGLVRTTSPKIQSISVADPACPDRWVRHPFVADLASDQTADLPERPRRRVSGFADHLYYWLGLWGSRGTLHVSTAGYALDDTYMGTEHRFT